MSTATLAPDPEVAPSVVEGRHQGRAALAAFVAVLLCAFILYVVVGHEHYWFLGDDFRFLSQRSGRSVSDLLRPHHDHWSTVPILVYRLLWSVFGLRTYEPYQLGVISLHLTAGVLIRVVMRRAGVRPWMATVVASTFVLLAGAGWQDIVWAFQIGFNGALVCGLAHLLLADHDGPLDRRDFIGLGFGVVGLMCSGVALTMTFVVGLAVLIRRGWRIALIHTVPLALLYFVWWFRYARAGSDAAESSITAIAEFVQRGVTDVFSELGGFPGVGLALGVVLVCGLVLAWGRLPRSKFAAVGAAPAAMLAGGVVFLAIAGYGRAGESGGYAGETSRYVHIVVALVAPSLAVAADAIARRWRLALPALIVLFLIAVPGNIADLWPEANARDPLTLTSTDHIGDPEMFLTVAHLELLRNAPRNFRPFHMRSIGTVPIGWIQDNVDSGQIPDYDASPDEKARARLLVGLEQRPRPSEPNRACVPFEARTVQLEAGEHFDFDGTVLVRVVGSDGGQSPVVPKNSRFGSRLAARFGPLSLDVAPKPGTTTRECE